MSLAAYLIHKGIVRKPTENEMPHKGKKKSEQKEISEMAESIESGEGKEKIDAMTRKMKQRPYMNV